MKITTAEKAMEKAENDAAIKAASAASEIANALKAKEKAL